MAWNGICCALLASVLAITVGSADAGNARAARKQVESSMLVTGSVTIRPDGAVQSHEIDPRIDLTPDIRSLVDNAARQWTFEPVKVDGRIVTARVPMSLRLVARPADQEGRYNVRIASVQFGSVDASKGVVASIKKLVPPTYPKSALQMGGKGTVYLLVRVDHGGHVIEADVEQVNLRVVGSSQQMDTMRRDFAQACVRAARNWTFTPPATGPDAGAAHWTARVPIDFVLSDDKRAAPGQWDTYVPGPRKTNIPWAEEQLRTAGSPDALPEGGVYPLGHGARLLDQEAG